MKKSKATKAIEKIAVREGKSTEEIRQSMQEAIDAAYEKHDESAQEFWDKWKNRKPTPEEFIIAMSQRMRDEFGSLL